MASTFRSCRPATHLFYLSTLLITVHQIAGDTCTPNLISCQDLQPSGNCDPCEKVGEKACCCETLGRRRIINLRCSKYGDGKLYYDLYDKRSGQQFCPSREMPKSPSAYSDIQKCFTGPIVPGEKLREFKGEQEKVFQAGPNNTKNGTENVNFCSAFDVYCNACYRHIFCKCGQDQIMVIPCTGNKKKRGFLESYDARSGVFLCQNISLDQVCQQEKNQQHSTASDLTEKKDCNSSAAGVKIFSDYFHFLLVICIIISVICIACMYYLNVRRKVLVRPNRHDDDDVEVNLVERNIPNLANIRKYKKSFSC